MAQQNGADCLNPRYQYLWCCWHCTKPRQVPTNTANQGANTEIPSKPSQITAFPAERCAWHWKHSTGDIPQLDLHRNLNFWWHFVFGDLHRGLGADWELKAVLCHWANSKEHRHNQNRAEWGISPGWSSYSPPEQLREACKSRTKKCQAELLPAGAPVPVFLDRYAQHCQLEAQQQKLKAISSAPRQ